MPFESLLFRLPGLRWNWRSHQNTKTQNGSQKGIPNGTQKGPQGLKIQQVSFFKISTSLEPAPQWQGLKIPKVQLFHILTSLEHAPQWHRAWTNKKCIFSKNQPALSMPLGHPGLPMNDPVACLCRIPFWVPFGGPDVGWCDVPHHLVLGDYQLSIIIINYQCPLSMSIIPPGPNKSK